MKSIYFNEEHHLFREAVRVFLEREVDTETWEKEKRIPREMWKKMGELGFLGISFPEVYGGSGADFFHSAVFLEEIGRVGAAGFGIAVGVQEYVATEHILKFGSEELKQGYLVPSIQGDKIGALAVSEPEVGSDVAKLRTRAVRDGDHYVINGAKTFITNGVYGDFVTVAVRTGGDGKNGISLIVVDQGTPGFSASLLQKMGCHCSDTGELNFENVSVPADNLIGQENMGFYYIMECFQQERLVAALSTIGGCETCLETTLEYIRTREAFGRPVSRFQVIRHRLADASCELEAMRQLVYHATWLHNNGEHAVKECSMAKLKATELSKTIADECLQCYGGYGYMEEYPLARMYRDVRAGTIAGGTSEIIREIIAKIIVDGVQYQAPSGAQASSANQTQADSGPAMDEIFHSLPERYKGDPALNLCVHFDFQQDGEDTYTVVLKEGACTVATGLQGEADCTVTTAGAVYRDIELGNTSPEAAFMAGQIQVTSIPVMMQYTSAFVRLAKT